MQVSTDLVRAMLDLQKLHLPDDEIDNVAIRFSNWLAALDDIEATLGEQMNDVDPIPPVYPHEEF